MNLVYMYASNWCLALGLRAGSLNWAISHQSFALGKEASIIFGSRAEKADAADVRTNVIKAQRSPSLINHINNCSCTFLPWSHSSANRPLWPIPWRRSGCHPSGPPSEINMDGISTQVHVLLYICCMYERNKKELPFQLLLSVRLTSCLLFSSKYFSTNMAPTAFPRLPLT